MLLSIGHLARMRAGRTRSHGLQLNQGCSSTTAGRTHRKNHVQWEHRTQTHTLCGSYLMILFDEESLRNLYGTSF